MKSNFHTTILAVGERADYDTFKKFNKEKRTFKEYGFDYVKANYKKLMYGKVPIVKSENILIFLFFPFSYWNRYIEHKNYAGIYGNRMFQKKFCKYLVKVDRQIKKIFSDKKIFFINEPYLCGLYRDKLLVLKTLSKAGIPTPKLYQDIRSIKQVHKLLEDGKRLFIKPICGSMGKGITYLSWKNWQTNFIFDDNRIISRLSDRGWQFRDITDNDRFLSRLIRKDVLIEEAIDPVVLGEMKIDLRIYVFFKKILYIYPRKNHINRVTTNISQGAKGAPEVLKLLPPRQLELSKKVARKTAEVLGLNLLGMDVVLDRNLKDIFVVDINVFPGFPKIRTFNLTHAIIKELSRLERNGKLIF